MSSTVSFLAQRSVLDVPRGGPRSASDHKVSGHERVLAPHSVAPANLVEEHTPLCNGMRQCP